MPLLFERGLVGEETGETVSLDLKLEKWEGLRAGGSTEGEAVRQGAGRESSDKEMVSRACPLSPYHLLWLPSPWAPPGGSSPLLLFQKTGV